MSSWDTEVRDSWGGSLLSIPAISWADHRPGDGFTGGILLPTPGGRFAGLGYYEVPVMHQRTISVVRNGKLVVEDNPEAGKPKRWSDGNIVQQTVLTLLTPLRTLDYGGLVSEKAIEKMDSTRKSPTDEEGTFLGIIERYGLRRLYIQGQSLDQGFRAAVKAKGRKPEPAGVLSVSIDELKQNDHGGRTKIFRVEYDLPTPESSSKVAEYLRKHGDSVSKFLNLDQKQETAESPASQPPSGMHGDDDDDEPPF